VRDVYQFRQLSSTADCHRRISICLARPFLAEASLIGPSFSSKWSPIDQKRPQSVLRNLIGRVNETGRLPALRHSRASQSTGFWAGSVPPNAVRAILRSCALIYFGSSQIPDDREQQHCGFFSAAALSESTTPSLSSPKESALGPSHTRFCQRLFVDNPSVMCFHITSCTIGFGTITLASKQTLMC
jgi:hypothetical protein